MRCRSLFLGLLLGLVVALPVRPGAAQLPLDLVGNPHVRWGYPGGNCQLLKAQYFLICSDVPHRVPLWVTYHLTRDDLRSRASRKNNFHADKRLPRGDRAENADYVRSGYDRGHMAPAADFKRGPKAMSTTFLLTNMAPQRPNLNRRIWEQLEGDVRELAHNHGSIWIITGPLFLNSAGTSAVAPDSFIGPGRVAVPTHFFKVVFCEHAAGHSEMFAFIMPNQQEPFTETAAHYRVSVDEVERLTRLNFFDLLPDAVEVPLEAARASRWPIF